MKSLILVIILSFIKMTIGNSQDTLYHLQDTIHSSLVQYSIQADSTVNKNGSKYEYFAINSSNLIPNLQNYDSIYLRIKTTDNVSTIKQFYSKQDADGWVEYFINNKNYNFIICNHTNKSKNFSIDFELEKINGVITFRTPKAFFLPITIQDTTLNFIIRPYIIPQQNISLIKRGDNKYETFEFNESFKINQKYYKLSELDLVEKSIMLVNIDELEGQYGYKSGKKIKKFQELNSRIKNQLLFNSNIDESEFYLLHFWGEWCFPCIKKIKSNNILFSQIDSTKANVINIALSLDKESESKTIKLIQDENITGNHLIEKNDSLRGGSIDKLKISIYPSYLLINNEGEIIFRSDSPKNEKQIEDVLKELKIINKN